MSFLACLAFAAAWQHDGMELSATCSCMLEFVLRALFWQHAALTTSSPKYKLVWVVIY
jgi:hypothetical protein